VGPIGQATAVGLLGRQPLGPALERPRQLRGKRAYRRLTQAFRRPFHDLTGASINASRCRRGDGFAEVSQGGVFQRARFPGVDGDHDPTLPTLTEGHERVTALELELVNRNSLLVWHLSKTCSVGEVEAGLPA